LLSEIGARLGRGLQQPQQESIAALVVASLIAHIVEYSMTTDMFNTPGSVKTLRRYWENRIAHRDPTELASELVNESDRAVVILGATILDDALTELLAKQIVISLDQKQLDYIFRFEGPLGSFSSRIEVAYLFGFIGNNTRSHLTDIREMRNACAHSKQEMTFATKELVNVAKRLSGSLRANTQAEVRLAFLAEFIILVHALAQEVSVAVSSIARYTDRTVDHGGS
jgi:DNA-binding MltR family transcriptional regulator